MDIEQFREYCLAFEGVTEKMPFGKFAARYDSILAFYVLDHMFCFIDIDNFTFANIKSTPDGIEELWMRYNALSKPINRSLKHWVQVTFGHDIPDAKILELTADAYRLVKTQYGKKKSRPARG